MTRTQTVFVFFGGLFLCGLGFPASAADTPANPGREFQRIADAFDGHVHPAICVTKSGAVLVAHFAEKAGQIYLVRSADGGRTWKDAGKLADIGGGQPYP